ncbi:MAG: helix-turn-helix domain-containing protein [bacterium]|nr:helix-turn-helix domain-containing protein [bacterium]
MFCTASLGTRIRARREKLGLKQVDLANALQVTPQAVSKWERGENAPDISVLVPLAKLFGLSTDSLLGYHETGDEALQATVLFTDIKGTSRRVHAMEPRQVVTWLNGLFFQLTEIVLQYDGIPVQYSGDSFLCFFSGEKHQSRAVRACIGTQTVLPDAVHMGLHSGTIHPCAIGHPDYSSPGIAIGDTTILAFRTSEWAGGNTRSGIAATDAVVEGVDDRAYIGGKQSVHFSGVDDEVDVYEIMDKAS